MLILQFFTVNAISGSRMMAGKIILERIDANTIFLELWVAIDDVEFEGPKLAPKTIKIKGIETSAI